MEDKLSIAIYARVSSQRQAEDLTIQSQLAAIKKRIQDDKLHLNEELCFLDEGYSGATLVRPALEQLRDASWAGSVDRLYVHSPDRLARKYAYQVVLLEEFQKHDVEIVFLNHDPQEHPSAEGNLLLQMQGMISEYERAKILEHTRRGRRFAARQGKVSAIAHAPYGYRYVSKHEGDGEARWDIVDRDRGEPCGSTPLTPPGIRFTYHGGSIGLSVGRFGYSRKTNRIEIGVTQCLLHRRVSRHTPESRR